MTDNPPDLTSSSLQDTMIEILVDLENRLIETSAAYPDLDMEGLSENDQVFRCPRCRKMSLRRISYSPNEGRRRGTSMSRAMRLPEASCDARFGAGVGKVVGSE